MYKIFMAISFVFFTYRSYSAIIYVNTNATGTNNGSSWTNAFTDLQNALSVAFINDEIWVAAGSYKPTQTEDRALSFVMKKWSGHVWRFFWSRNDYCRTRPGCQSNVFIRRHRRAWR
jgi:hypothetical protein